MLLMFYEYKSIPSLAIYSFSWKCKGSVMSLTTQQNLMQKATDVDVSAIARNLDLASLKLDVDKLDIDKLKTIPSNLMRQIHYMQVN